MQSLGGKESLVVVELEPPRLRDALLGGQRHHDDLQLSAPPGLDGVVEEAEEELRLAGEL